MRWKALFASDKKDNKIDESRDSECTYGLKSFNCPPPVKELIEFENELFKLVKKIKFRRYTSNFQTKLQDDIKNIRSSTKTFTPADKTSNMYNLSKEEYNKLLHNAITSTYKKTSSNMKEDINKTGMKIAKDKKVLNKMEINGESNCFITLKDHKENFENNPTTRLLNPAKNEIGRISKAILDKINTEVRSILSLNQWKNTSNVIDWFKGIKDKSVSKFIIFDIKDFYPSITQELLTKALTFAKKHTNVSKEDINVIQQARKSLLFNNGESWIKKDSGLFDVTMGAYDGAEICELVGVYILSLLSKKCVKNDIGLYRDDGLAVFKNISGPQSEKIKKTFQDIFNANNLKIERTNHTINRTTK